jgi:hypothetical protein
MLMQKQEPGRCIMIACGVPGREVGISAPQGRGVGARGRLLTSWVASERDNVFLSL